MKILDLWCSLKKIKTERSDECFCEPETPRFFIDFKKRNEVVSVVNKCFPSVLGEISGHADKICEHTFNLLGSGDVYLGETINWHCDFKTGYCWDPKQQYGRIKIPYGKADIKVPWELSRFQHLTILGYAYWLSGDEKYTKEFIGQINSWIENNPPRRGVNWTCTMDVAIRACNWIAGYHFFKNSFEIAPKFLDRFLDSLYKHGKHIMANLEGSMRLTTNHYLSNIVGLIYLGMMFSKLKEARKWREFGFKELIKEMERQVYSDGCDFEASTCYHRLVLELFFFATLLIVINDKEFKGENYSEIAEKTFGRIYTEKLYKMFEVVLHLLKPNGQMPQIGDNDSGQLVNLYYREVLDMRYLLALGAVFFKEPKWKIKEFFKSNEEILEVLITYGKNGIQVWNSLEWNSIENIGSKAFINAGWYVMRNNKDYCLISCGPNGENGLGGHCHNDKLSFELNMNGHDIIVDPGTYVYTALPEARNRFRSTARHNTVLIDGKEQNKINKHNIFKMGNGSHSRCLKFETGKDTDIFVGEYYGYKHFLSQVIHQREIKFHKKEKKLEIIDRFKGKGKHDLEWNFVLSPHLSKDIEIHSEELAFYKEFASYSSEYGKIEKTKKITSRLNATIPLEVKIFIKSM
ncbi:MAG: heparinase [Candidatus Omnitrophica bacterium CG07_land_8_20_14_0_80_42_15]|uniref:Heparinase n=1 Tax=Candidatus Aquitaenariimonas noxiae TaxID=1974741 RepID=A0A2J0KWS1_9BACT|nr:MAG: heparinase [Candidatus Omnitrophica bacterium CG07_land_8_20_14_0_80_42_15]